MAAPLTFMGAGGGGNRVVFTDERDRDDVPGPASITLDGHDESWGEFLTLPQLALLGMWCQSIVATALLLGDA